MSQDLSFRRKAIYMVIIVLLLFPLFWIGQPATRDSSGDKRPGGILAQLREKHNLSQANLGDIDPASESMKLATLGLRGVAANVLWEKAHRYKMKEDWDSLSATLKQITKLQPNFITVWEHQAHNLSYNISVEFDDYRLRYHWVKKGISFLVEGVKCNRENPRLLHNTGWTTGQKLGRADEHLQFREMFRDDTDFHDEMIENGVSVQMATGWDGRPDSWLLSRQWYLRAEASPMPLKGKSPLIFYRDAPMALVNYAAAIEEEGTLGRWAQEAWVDAGVAWSEFGERPIPTSWGHNIRLGDYQVANDKVERLRESLEELAPGQMDQIREEKLATLTDEERVALDMPEEELTEQNYQATFDARSKVTVSYEEVAERAPEKNREKAITVVAQLRNAEDMSQRISHYRGVINYDYWETRCAAEQTKAAVAARQAIYDATQHLDAARLEDARQEFESAWANWRKVFDEYPRLMDDVAADDLILSIRKYERLLTQLDEDFPPDFPLVDFVKLRVDEEDIAEMYRRMNKQRPADDSQGDDTDDGEEAGQPEDSASPVETDESESDEPAEVPETTEESSDMPDMPAEEPPAEDPSAEEPSAEEPSAEEPSAEEPSAEEPPAEEPPAEPKSSDER